MTDDAKFLKKHIRTGAIDVHPTERALVINYQLEATILGELGDPMAGERKECQKIVRLKDLNKSTDISALAREVAERCKLIPASKIPEVEQLLYYLQNRRDQQGNDIGSEIQERASINRMDEYIDMLYEEISEKVRGTALLLQLARNPDNMEELIQNETLLGALARVLREDWKKNLELATNIVYTFFCFSTFSPFHSMISHFKVGALSMQIVEYELKRYDLWKDDLRSKTGITDPFTQRAQMTKEQEKNFKKFQLLSKKQEQLLRVSLYLLLNLAEDVKTEVKMMNRGLVGMLVKILERRDNQELLVLALTFLKKLSVFTENKDAMADSSIIERMSRLFPCNNADLLEVMVCLLYNLSFDTVLRGKIIAAGLVKHIVPLIGRSTRQNLILALLYHLSMDDDCKAMFTYTEVIPLCMTILLEREDPPVELKSLLINLAICKRNAQILAGNDGEGLKLVVEKAFEKRDSILLKLVRNIAEHDGPTKPMLVEFVGDLAGSVKRDAGSQKSSDFSLECLRILGCLNLHELDWDQLLKEYTLIPWLKEKLNPESSPDDIILEIIILLGTVAMDVNGAKLLFSENLISSLVSLLGAKQEDDEIVLQIIYVFYQIMLHNSLGQRLLNETQVPAYLIDLMHDKNPEIRKMCDNALEVISENGEEWAKKIQEEKFRWHNAQWLDMLSEKGTVGFVYDEDNELIDQDASDRSYVFGDTYAAAEDILENYDSDRPISRLDHRLENGSLSDD